MCPEECAMRPPCAVLSLICAIRIERFSCFLPISKIWSKPGLIPSHQRGEQFFVYRSREHERFLSSRLSSSLSAGSHPDKHARESRTTTDSEIGSAQDSDMFDFLAENARVRKSVSLNSSCGNRGLVMDRDAQQGEVSQL